jgi:hypothetical protein
LVIFRGCRIQFPAINVPLGRFLTEFQWLVVLILDARRFPDVVHDVVIGRGVRPRRCLGSHLSYVYGIGIAPG